MSITSEKNIQNGVDKSVDTMTAARRSFPFRSILSSLTPNVAAEMLRYGWSKPNILSLAQGEGSAATPNFIAEAAFKAMQEGKTFYAPVLGIPELRQEISNYYAHIFKLNIPAGRIFVTSSGTTAIHLALASVLEEGDEIVAVTPIWKNLIGAIELAQAKGVQVALEYKDDQGWTLDLNKLFDAVTYKTKAILLVSPSNPTGWVMKPHEIKTVLEFARERGIWIIADEVYSRIVYEGGRSASFLDYAEADDRLLVVNSFSKAWAMTGWRLGWLVGPAEAESMVRDIVLYENMGAPTFTQYGGIAALRHGESFITDQVNQWKSNLDLVMDRFRSNGRIRMYRPEATFYAFFNVEGEPDCLALVRRLIDEGSLSLAPGCSFGQCCAGWVRMCFAVSEQKIVDALDRLEQVVKPV
jgi:aspartate aminotransferase